MADQRFDQKLTDVKFPRHITHYPSTDVGHSTVDPISVAVGLSWHS